MWIAGLLISVAVNAQQISVTGTVSDVTGETLIGVNVVLKGTTDNGSITDIEGKYSLSGVPSNGTLVFSYVGYKTQEVAIGGRRQINVVMQEDAQLLDELVVVGYGSLSKKELSSSIVQVDKDQFVSGAMNNVMQLIAGKVAGLNVVTQSAADPNSNSSIQIRGAASITAGNDPLIVIDGIAGGDIRNLAPQDVESMTVLKDAGSAAIYGTRGANGVILITTRKGSGDAPGTARFTYDSYVNFNFQKPHLEILSADEFRRSRRGNDYGYDTNWWDLLSRDYGFEHNQYLGIDGSTRNGSYNASFNYKEASGLDKVSGREEFGARFAMEQRMLDNRLQINASMSARRVNETWSNASWGGALSTNPTMPVYNEDGSYYQPTSPTGASNMIANLMEITNNGQRMYLLGSVEAKLNILQTEMHQLSTSVSYSLQYNDLKSNYYAPSTTADSFWAGYKGNASISYSKNYTQRVEWLANYNLDLGEHDLKFVGGYTYEEERAQNFSTSNQNFAYDNILYNDIGSGTYLTEGRASMGSGQSLSKLVGVFGRLNYNWNDMLMASASLRYEGSTRFGRDHKWGYFPAGSVAWEMMKMDFMEPVNEVVTSLKPRISYGVTGRQGSRYASLSTYESSGSYFMNGAWVTGYAPSRNANPDLGWEKNVQANVGVDFVLWNRLRGSVEYFDRRSEDLLYNYTAPQPPFVYSSILVNVGTTRNTGIEVSLEGDIFKDTPVTWTSGINYSTGKTKLTKLSDQIYRASYVDLLSKGGPGTTEYFFRIMEGGLVGQFWGYKTAGAENGELLIYNSNDEVVPISQADASYKRYIGNAVPKHFVSWNNTVRYKDFDLNVFVTGAFGHKIFNNIVYGQGLQGSGTDNVLRDAYLKYTDVYSSAGWISDYFLEKGDYLKLDNVTLGYSFRPQPNKYVDNLRVYLTAKNIYTLTGYSGNDPSIVGQNGLTPGVDNSGAYPLATSVSLGLTIRFK
jgi:TonB-linked SusC/RagA family outer membrane protein